ncbi:nuclear pore complex protein NUP1 [Mercurialis annua]|uniref:nuclear pore complex protein NUP1 n=1 Tax=Mercurialis annua TaxID=3986 RepID=UPI002160652A|nr:nuclear pore complex protein NUP1 [Mercurialis annua]
MENQLLRTPFIPKTPLPPAEERGAGGKFIKPPSRRPPSTPYSRPPPQNKQLQPHGGDGRHWLSKLIVDPAYRLVSSGANLIFPSFFSNSESVNQLLPGSTDQQEEELNEDNLQIEVEQKHHGSGGENHVVFQNLDSSVTGVAGTSKSAEDKLISDTDRHEHNQDDIEVSDHTNDVFAIEQLLKNKKLSRNEINSLIELLNSRVVDVPGGEEQNKYLGTAVEGSGKLTEARREDLNLVTRESAKINYRKFSSAAPSDDGNAANSVENVRPAEEKCEDLDRVLWRSSTTPLQSKIQNEIGASPIDIARAYMENRTSEVGFAANSVMLKDEGTKPRGNEFALKSYIPSPVPKSSPSWPGALVQDQRGYMTPPSQRARSGLHNFPRTPYSRSINTKNKSTSIQLQGYSDRRRSMTSTPLQQTQAPSFGLINSRGNTLYDGLGSGGPIRRLRQKAIAESPRGSAYFQTSSKSGHLEDISVSEGLISTPRTNVGNRGTNSIAKFQSVGSKLHNSEVSFLGSKPQSSEGSVLRSKPQSSEVLVPTVPAHSSEVARKILEHLERNPPTPNDKSAEMRLATSWKKPQSTDLPTFMPNRLNNRLTRFGVLDSSEKSVQFHNNLSQEPVNVSVNNNASTSDAKAGTASTIADNPGSSQDFIKPRDPELMNSSKGTLKDVANATGFAVSNLKKLPPNTKPVLSSIVINKPSQRWNFSSDNSLGFTFPISAASGSSSEPPTPSILPSSAIIGEPQKIEVSSNQVEQNDQSSAQVKQNEGSSIPSFSFGLKRSTPPLVFSFPSTSSTPILDDASDLKFKFGSDDTTRISFSSVGKDAICY